MELAHCCIDSLFPINPIMSKIALFFAATSAREAEPKAGKLSRGSLSFILCRKALRKLRAKTGRSDYLSVIQRTWPKKSPYSGATFVPSSKKRMVSTPVLE